MRQWFDKWVFPMLSAWVVALCVHLVFCLYVMGSVGPWGVAALFATLALIEAFITRRFARSTPSGRIRLPTWLQRPVFDRYAPWGNLLLWALLSYWWIARKGSGPREMIAGLPTPPSWHWYGPDFLLRQLYINVYFILRAMGWMTAAAAALWLLTHYLLTIRWRRLRVLTGVFLPAGLSIGLLLHLYYWGGPGARSGEAVAARPGVEWVFRPEQLREALRASERDAAGEPAVKDFSYQSRSICFDPREKALFLMFGCEWCERTAALVRFGLESGGIRYLADYGARELTCREPRESIYFFSLAPTSLREVSKRDLSPLRTIELGAAPLPENWFPNSLLYDARTDRLYATDIFYASLVSIDARGGEIAALLNLHERGLARWRSTAWSPVLSRKTGRLYFLSSPDRELFEVDPESLAILRSLDLPGIGSIALALDDERQLLYVQSATTDALFRVDLETFAVDRTYEGEFFAMRMALDPTRPVLYVLGYLSGTLFALDVESGERLWELAVGGRPGGMDLHEDTLWVHSLAGAFRVDLPALWREIGLDKRQNDGEPLP